MPAAPLPPPVRARRLADLDQRSRRRAIVRASVTVVGAWVLLLAVYYVLPVSGWAHGSAVLRLALAIAGFSAVIAWQIRGIMRSELPAVRAAQVFGAAVPLLFVLFSTVYLSMATAFPSQFNEPLDHTRALYFVVTVFATVGFGDIVPKSDTARIVVMVQMIFDLLVIGLVARLLIATAKATLARSDTRGEAGRAPELSPDPPEPRAPAGHKEVQEELDDRAASHPEPAGQPGRGRALDGDRPRGDRGAHSHP